MYNALPIQIFCIKAAVSLHRSKLLGFEAIQSLYRYFPQVIEYWYHFNWHFFYASCPPLSRRQPTRELTRVYRWLGRGLIRIRDCCITVRCAATEPPCLLTKFTFVDKKKKNYLHLIQTLQKHPNFLLQSQKGTLFQHSKFLHSKFLQFKAPRSQVPSVTKLLRSKFLLCKVPAVQNSYVTIVYTMKLGLVKETVARDFRALIFFINQPHLGLWCIP
jgi:hypothetical protein